MTYVPPTSDDLGTYLGDTTVNVLRAELFIDQAQTLCGSVVSPLPDGAEVVVMRVAARAYVTVTQARQVQAAGSGMPFGALPTAGGDIRLTASDIADLRRMATGSGAFTVDILPVGYVAPVGYGCYSGDFDVIP